MVDYKNIRKVFPAGNTTKGFYSFFDYIIGPDANRVFILKGGPGVGKSNFMKKIGRKMLQRGYFIEEHYCSSSNNSIDGLVIPELKVALMDGTAPHIYDPRNPGAVDEIINLGDFWNVKNLQKNKEEIRIINKEVSKCFSRAYQYLTALRPIIKDISTIYRENIDKAGYYKHLEALLERVSCDSIGKDYPYERHLFGCAITPIGVVDYSETTIGTVKDIYIIKGEWGTGWPELLNEIARKVIRQGLDIEIFHSPFDPDTIQDLIISDLNLAFTTNNKFLYKAREVIDLDELADKATLKKYREELEFNNKIYHQLLEQAIKNINKAKITHDRLESFYIPNMDFNKVNEKRIQIVNSILQ